MSRLKFEPNWVTHPGDHLQEYLEIRGWSQAEFARRAKMTPKHVSEIINGKAPVTAEYALRFSKVLRSHIKPEMWMALQASHDLFHARKKKL